MQKKTTLLSIVTLASLITTQLSAINFSYLFPKKQPASSPIIKYISSNPKTIMAITSAAIAMPVAAYLYIKRNDVACYLTSTKLLLACKSGNLDLVKSILSNCNEDIVNKVNYNNETPLFWACLINNPAMIRILIANGAKKSINTASSKTGNTPLSLTLYNDNLKMMKFLLDNGADINQSILMHSTTVLKIACDNTNFNAVKFLVENGADINKADIYGQTPLFIASAEKSINIVKYLLDNSANIDIANIKGETPFSFACDDNNIELMELLLSIQKNVKKRHVKKIAFHLATFFKADYKEVYKSLLSFKDFSLESYRSVDGLSDMWMNFMFLQENNDLVSNHFKAGMLQNIKSNFKLGLIYTSFRLKRNKENIKQMYYNVKNHIKDHKHYCNKANNHVEANLAKILLTHSVIAKRK